MNGKLPTDYRYHLVLSIRFKKYLIFHQLMRDGWKDANARKIEGSIIWIAGTFLSRYLLGVFIHHIFQAGLDFKISKINRLIDFDCKSSDKYVSYIRWTYLAYTPIGTLYCMLNIAWISEKYKAKHQHPIVKLLIIRCVDVYVLFFVYIVIIK